jgi:hypothetical protein
MNKSFLKKAIILAAISATFVLSNAALADRCLVDPVMGQPVCCSGDQEAIINPVTNRVECGGDESQNGPSCLVDPVMGQPVCCSDGQEAIINPVTNRVQCG